MSGNSEKTLELEEIESTSQKIWNFESNVQCYILYDGAKTNFRNGAPFKLVHVSIGTFVIGFVGLFRVEDAGLFSLVCWVSDKSNGLSFSSREQVNCETVAVPVPKGC